MQKDSEIIKKVDSLSGDELKYYSDNFYPLDLKHYMSLQMTWVNDEKYFTGLKLNHNPNSDELLCAWTEHHNSERFRAFYILKYPDRVRKY